MQGEGKEDGRLDPRALRTRTAIKNAFFELVVKKDASRVTVKDLTDRAGINRKTFYLHYEAIENLYDEVLRDVMDEFFNQYETTPEVPEDLAGHAIRFFEFLSRQPLTIERLICITGYYDFGRKLYYDQMMRYKTAGDPFTWMPKVQYELTLNFIRSTALDFYRQWVAGGKAIPAEEAAPLLAELTCHGTERIMR